MAGRNDGAILPLPSHQRMSYHVFLSFRGEDTRKTFTDHMYMALIHAGFRTFKDDNGIERGEDVTSELQNAIRQSRSSIIILSKNYASSRWCLDELCLILERKKSVKHIVLPVFYDVDPSEVRKQTGSFAKAFYRHEKKHSKDKVKKWRAPLAEVADCIGMVLKNQEDGHEAKFILKVIKLIGDKLHQPLSVLSPYLIGIDSTVGSLNQWLRDGSNSVSIAVLCGMGGIGKTTIAKFVYNKNLKYFDGGSFLDEVREASKRAKGLVHLQKKLLADILKGKDDKIWSVDDGILKIQEALCNKRIFLVLDDVDHIEQINDLFGMRNWFHPGSKIIITTRHGHLLRTSEAYTIHDAGVADFTFQDHEFCKVVTVKELDLDNSRKLFSLYAFGQDYPIEEYASEAARIVNYCGGLPLALKVLGSSLRGKSSIDIWRSTANKLQAIPNNKIMEKLKISFDSLQDDHDRNLFLHIVCFFIGKDRDSTVKILDECEFYTLVGLDNLIDRCVLSVDDRNNKLRMHQLLRDMGREIIRQESPRNPGKRSRLWHHKDSFRVLNEKSGTKTIEGLILDMHMFNENHPPSGKKFYNGETPTLPGHYTDCLSEPHETSKDPGERITEFNVDTFMEMHQLTILHLKHVQLAGNYENFPTTLRWLSWNGFPHVSIPNALHLDGVVALNMCSSNLNQVFTQPKFLGSLRILDLRHSHSLRCTPDFSLLPNIEILVLKYCTSLVEIHETIGCLQNLIVLNLKRCENLEKLPNNIAVLRYLEMLDISWCISIKQLPDLSKLDYLKVFLADGLAMSQLLAPSNILDTNSSEAAVSLGLLKLSMSPETSWAVCLPSTLMRLSLSDCNLSDNDFPKDLNRLSSLRTLELKRNLITRLPEFIKWLHLSVLNLESCENLECLEGLPELEKLFTESCTSLMRITFEKTENHVGEWSFMGCNSLIEYERDFKLEPLEKAGNGLIKSLGLNNLENLTDMEVFIACRYWSALSILPVQGLYEKGAFSVFIPGEEIPDWFAHKCSGSTLFLSVPTVPNHEIQGLNICGVYLVSLEWNWDYSKDIPLSIQVLNIRKRLTWFMRPSCCGITADDEHMMWFCHVIFNQPYELEKGDELHVSVIADDDGFHVKECGASFVLDNESLIQDDVFKSFHSHGKDVEDSTRFWFKLGVDFEQILESTDDDEDVVLDDGKIENADTGNVEPNKLIGLLRKVLIGTVIGVLSFGIVSKASSFLKKNKKERDRCSTFTSVV